ncbi:MAG TPA: alpha/beta fold hydrolase, partial [Acidimicrobiales bacterium]
MAAVIHRTVDADGTRIHLVEQGEGPLVLLVHGFPESWYSWRHQLPALAAAGYRAAAIDVRGYGRSSKPAAIDAYRMLAHVADNLGVVAALEESSAVVVGHDWGAPIAANSALLRPDVFRAVALLSVPFATGSPTRPTDAFRRMGGNEEFYISYFQEPGRAEAEIEEDVRAWLLGMYIAASGDAVRSPDGGTMATVAPGGRLRDRFVIPDELPPWLTEEDLDFYTGEFERGGFAGPLNRYRNVDRDWEDLRVW